jgi:hypothetical protein
MPCCGQKRAQFQAPASTNNEQSKVRSSGAPKVVFQYTGRTAMAVIGPVSGIRYSFASPDARVEVDQRDSRLLAGVPNLRRVAFERSPM